MSYGTHRDVGDVERREAQYNASVSAATVGFGKGLAFSAPTAYLLNRSWPAFRNLTPAIKVFFVSSIAIGSGVIAADKAGIAFDQAHYTDAGAAVQRRYQSREERQWSELSSRDKALTWAKENKFAVVAATWATSMGGIFAYIHTQPMSFAQKLVQARVWAQGITLASLVGMAAITQIPSAGDKIIKQHKEAADHSWREFLPKEPAKDTVSSQ
ncbi:uncharacterized protein UBRO_05954 [Ustilago bromivora]|uniref:HIG1 domain-containing protein n=1 Tax=Ustilago bromivora TaxID=307758 RepID=A0A1K0GAE0_9BASI|nr:hypothetical protein NDA13_000959 [Ustilago tritici]SAM84853.1 uncharacterized protein UBRO_05954 [Ustilago bromivora]SYW75754.1 uncharacterized protein UBRO2_00909 [Ustilago bromivora]